MEGHEILTSSNSAPVQCYNIKMNNNTSIIHCPCSNVMGKPLEQFNTMTVGINDPSKFKLSDIKIYNIHKLTK